MCIRDSLHCLYMAPFSSFTLCKYIISVSYTHLFSTEEFYDLSSDNSPIILTLSITGTQKSFSSSLTNKWTEWNAYREELEQRIELNVPLNITVQLDMDVEETANNIQ